MKYTNAEIAKKIINNLPVVYIKTKDNFNYLLHGSNNDIGHIIEQLFNTSGVLEAKFNIYNRNTKVCIDTNCTDTINLADIIDIS